MSRCSICDYTTGEARSIYFTSLVDSKGSGGKRSFYVNQKTGDLECSVCYTSLKADLASRKEPDEDTAFTMPVRQKQ